MKIHVSPTPNCCKVSAYKRQIDVNQLSTEMLQQQLINLSYNLVLSETQKSNTRDIINRELSERLFSWRHG